MSKASRRLGLGFGLLISALIWSVAAIGGCFLAGMPLWIAWVFIGVFALCWCVCNRRRLMVGIAVVAAAAVVLFVFQIEPRNDREWWEETSVLPEFTVAGDTVAIAGFRKFRWRTEKDFDAKWATPVFDLSQLTELDLIVVPFGRFDLAAHTMLDFGFADGRRVVVSVEARKEKHEKFGLLAGMFRQLELITLFGDEQDLLNVRAVCRGNKVYAYPVKCDHGFRRSLFLSLAKSANTLHDEPKFYTSIRQNCTTTLVDHVDEVDPGEKIGWRLGTLLPALSGELLFDIGRMDTTAASYEEAKKRYQIDDLIREHADDADYVNLIRPRARGK